MEIVLDKSFLLGAPARQLQVVLQQHTPCIPGVLFHELMKDDEYRAQAFARLPPNDNSIVLVPGIGNFMRHEIETRLVVTSLAKHPLAHGFKLNPSFAKPEYELESWILEDNREQTAFYAKVATGMFNFAPLITTIFRELQGFRPGLKGWDESFRAAARSIGGADAVVQSIYGAMRKKNHEWPDVSHIKRTSVFFRLIQVDLLLALRHF